MNNQKLFASFIVAFFIITVAILFATSNLFAQTPKIKIIAQPEKIEVRKDEKFNLKVEISLPKPWYTYSMKEQIGPDGVGPTALEFSFSPENALAIDGDIRAAKPKTKHDEGFEMTIEYYEGKIEFLIPVRAKKNLNFAKDKVEVLAYMQLCNATICLPPDDYKGVISNKTFNEDTVDTVVENTEENTATVADIVDTVKENQLPPNENVETIQKTEAQMEIERKKSEGSFAFLWFAMGMGALSLLTPCVFPMIPITVSFFTKRAEKEGTKTVRDAFVYAGGIVMTFTGLGILLSVVLGATAIGSFAASGWVNLLITAIFIVFALNLFGAFELQIPSGLMNKLNQKSSQGSGLASVLLMALTFSLASFTCTGPFVGSALVAASDGEWFYPILGMLGFSGVLAAPFFLLALFPSFMSKMPKSGGWMNNVKVVMGFVVIAASLKFLSNADMAWGWGFLPKELFLAVWVAVCLLIALYVLGLFRLKLDSKVESLNASRVIWAVIFASLGFYFMTGMFGKSLGGEIDAFLPPAEYRAMMGGVAIQTSTVSTSNENEIVWLKDYDEAVRISKETGKPLFIDFTGYTCTNCKWMEQNMFKRPDVAPRLEQFVKVKLYTDRRGEPYISNKKMQQEVYGSVELPLYVIVSAEGQHIGTKAFTRDAKDFSDFLDRGLATKR
jgi:thiol:disulfide interchange protein DsbD